jgi:hypothetical protein
MNNRPIGGHSSETASIHQHEQQQQEQQISLANHASAKQSSQ